VKWIKENSEDAFVTTTTPATTPSKSSQPIGASIFQLFPVFAILVKSFNA
jgi:hypothetical protein